METISFSGGLLLALVILTVVVAMPVKLAAHFADAQRTGIIWCVASVAVGLVLGALASRVAGGFIGGPFAAFLGFVIGMRFMLGTSLAAALGLTIIAFGLSLAGIFLLVHLGLMATTATVGVGP
jgi:hypothetical protein